MDLSKKNEYPTFARTTTLNSDVIYMILKLLKKYDWKRFAIMYEKSHIWSSIYYALKKEVEKSHSLEIALTKNYVKTDSFTHAHESLVHIFEPFMDALPRKARSMLLMFYMFFSTLYNFKYYECVFVVNNSFVGHSRQLGSNSNGEVQRVCFRRAVWLFLGFLGGIFGRYSGRSERMQITYVFFIGIYIAFFTHVIFQHDSLLLILPLELLT